MNEEMLLNKIIELTRQNERLKLELEKYKQIDKDNDEKCDNNIPDRRRRKIGIKNETLYKL